MPAMSCARCSHACAWRSTSTSRRPKSGETEIRGSSPTRHAGRGNPSGQQARPSAEALPRRAGRLPALSAEEGACNAVEVHGTPRLLSGDPELLHPPCPQPHAECAAPWRAAGPPGYRKSGESIRLCVRDRGQGVSPMPSRNACSSLSIGLPAAANTPAAGASACRSSPRSPASRRNRAL